MKRQLLIALSLIICGGSLLAQPRGASQPELLIKANTGLMAPVWSPKGDKIAVTTDNYAGIFVANADGTNLMPVTTEAGTGYKMVWNAEGTEILGRANIVENRRTFHELKSYNVNTGAAKVIVAKSRAVSGIPTWKLADKSNLKAANKSTVYDLMASDPMNATKKIASLSQYAGKMVINPVLSPDGTKVAFQIPANGCFVCNIDGTNLVSLGKGSRPAWLPDSKNIIVSVETDNGEVLTSGDLYAVNVESAKRVNLTDSSDVIAVSPTVSPDGQKVAFENVRDASIYVINLKY